LQLVRVWRDEEQVPGSAGCGCAERELCSFARCWERDNGWSEFAGRLQVAPHDVVDFAVAVAADIPVGEAPLALGVRPLAALVPVEVLILA
jgi:hypothetical protein